MTQSFHTCRCVRGGTLLHTAASTSSLAAVKVFYTHTVCQEREVWVCSEDESIGKCLDETQIPWFSDPRQFLEIRGADIITYNRIKVAPDQPLDFHWEDYGFQIYIPAGAFSRPVTLCIEETISFQMMIMILLVVPFGFVSILL